MPTFVGSEVARTRSRVAVATRTGSPEDIEDARREHATAKIADCITKTLETAPQLRDAQRVRLIDLIGVPDDLTARRVVARLRGGAGV